MMGCARKKLLHVSTVPCLLPTLVCDSSTSDALPLLKSWARVQHAIGTAGVLAKITIRPTRARLAT